jgi:archaellum component FlaC
MNEKKKLEFQQKIISRQSKQIEDLKLQVAKLELELKEKNEVISSVDHLRNELSKDIAEVKGYKKEYKKLINELRKMKEIMNQEVYKGLWKLIRFLIK